MKRFIIRIVNLCLIVGILLIYNNITSVRNEADEETRLAYEEEKKKNAMENGTQEEVISSYEDGVYEGTASGFGGDITVEVVIENGEISRINIVSAEKEDRAYLNTATAIVDYILSAQSADVDTISGATYSSTGIKNAVAAALEKAEK